VEEVEPAGLWPARVQQGLALEPVLEPVQEPALEPVRRLWLQPVASLRDCDAGFPRRSCRPVSFSPDRQPFPWRLCRALKRPFSAPSPWGVFASRYRLRAQGRLAWPAQVGAAVPWQGAAALGAPAQAVGAVGALPRERLAGLSVTRSRRLARPARACSGPGPPTPAADRAPRPAVRPPAQPSARRGLQAAQSTGSALGSPWAGLLGGSRRLPRAAYWTVCTASAMRPTPALLSSSMTLTTVS
jgi:hypothetical protein